MNENKKSKINGWYYIKTDEDINFISKRIMRFHDASIVAAHYNPSRNVNTGENIVLTLILNVVYCENDNFAKLENRTIEIEFNGVQGFQIMPTEIYEGSQLLPGAVIIIRDEYILWHSNGAYSKNVESWVKSTSIKWRFSEYMGGIYIQFNQ